MANTHVSSRKFRKHPNRTRKAANREPVIITKRGRPTHILITIEEYQKLTGKQQSIVDLLAMPEGGGVDLDPPRLSGDFVRPPDFT